MRLLRISVSGLPNFKDVLDIDFIAKQRVDNIDKEQLNYLFSNLYTNPAISFIGINASGKTTILKAISFAVNLLNNEPINSIQSKEILDELDGRCSVCFTVYFYHNEVSYKLETLIGKKINSVDGSTKFVILDENLWSKDIRKIRTKKVFMIFIIQN